MKNIDDEIKEIEEENKSLEEYKHLFDASTNKIIEEEL